MIYTLTLNPAVDRELTVPEILFDTVLRASDSRVDFGGKGFNVSRMLVELGAISVALGFAGGKSGERLQEGLVGLGIETDFTWIEGETRTNVSVVSTAQARNLKVNEAGPTISESEWSALLDKISRLARSGDWWVLAGSLPPGVPATAYAQIIRDLRAAGAHTVLDTSGDALRHACAARPDLVKPNDVEAAGLTGLAVTSEADIVVAAAAVQALGPAQVVISRGKDGALATNSRETWRVLAPAVTALNPIGAGDALVAGMVWILEQEQSLLEAVRWGVACGTATAMQKGTAVGPRALVETLLAQLEVARLA